MYIPRHITNSLQTLKDKYPVIALTGPRQSGKTTLIRKTFPNHTYVSLENPDLRERAITDPNSFLGTYSGDVIFDEVQRVPQLFSYLQTVVDLNQKMGEYILSGSQNFLLLESITQSLAGRVALLKLMPLSFQEMEAEGLMKSTWEETTFQGFYPAIFDRELEPTIFYPNYLETYLERDVRTLTTVKDLRLFQIFLKRCAANVGQVLNLSSLASEVGITSPTAKSWLSLLESSYIVFTLSPYFRNFNKRIIKSPKLFFYDTGLVCSLLEMNTAKDIDRYFQRGSLFENLIVAEFHKLLLHQGKRPNFYFWQDSNHNEIDLLWEEVGKINLLEIKSGKTFSQSWLKNLHKISSVMGEQVDKKILIYGGDEEFNHQGVSVKSWKQVVD
ncbi:MAG: ATP-binding protein [Bacteroidia bacterium]